MTNPADGFSGTAQVTLGNATLSYFAAADGGVPAVSPDQAILSVILIAKYPVNLNDATVTGHYLGAQSPLPTSFLSFTAAWCRTGHRHDERVGLRRPGRPTTTDSSMRCIRSSCLRR